MKRILLAVAAAFLSVGSGPASLAAQAAPKPQPQPDGSIALVSQPPWQLPGQGVALSVKVSSSSPASSLALAGTLCRHVESRSEFALTVQDKARCPVLDSQSFPLTQLEGDGGGGYQFRLPANGHLTEQGVYPIRIDLRTTSNQPLDHFITHIVVASTAPADTRLGLAWVVPVHAQTTVAKDGARSLVAGGADSAVATIAAATSHPSVPLTLAPTPSTVDLLASGQPADQQAVATLAKAVAGQSANQLVTGPYAPINVPAMLSAGLAAEVTDQAVRGSDALAQRLQARPDPRTWVANDAIDAASLSALNSRGVDRVVLPEAAMTPLNLSRTLTQPFAVEARQGVRIAAMAADPGLGTHFQTGDDPVLAAHQFLADLAVIYFDAPGSRTARAVAAVPPNDWPSDPVFLNTVLDGLTANPIVAPITLDDLFSSVAAATAVKGKGVLLRSLAPSSVSPDDALPGSAIRNTRRRLSAFGSMLDPDNQPSADVYDQIELGLLASESTDLRGRQHAATLDAVDRLVGKQLAMIHMPPNRSVRLTARQGDIPITVLSDAPYPLHVVLNVERSDKFRYTVPQMPPLARRATVVPMGVEVRTSGAFPLKVSIDSPDEGLTISQTHFTVRSTAASGVGIVLSIGAGVFLLVWWLRHFRHGRRAGELLPA